VAPPRLHFRVPPEPSHLLRARERLRDYLRQYCTEAQVIDDVVLCVEEAATNAIRHSGSDRDIEISLRFAHGDLLAQVKDHGRGFDLGSFDREALPDVLSDQGRGLFIVAKLMDSLELRLDGGLEVRMARRATSHAEPVRFDSSLGDAFTGVLPRGNLRMRAVLEEIDEGFVALDWEYRYTHLNEAMLRLMGRSRDEVLGKVIWELFPELGRTPVPEHCRAAMELGKPSAIEHRSQLSGDWFEMRIYPTSAGISIYFRDINERKQTEAQLRESQALLQAVLDGSPDPVFVKDRQSRILLGNAALLEVWGKPAEAVIGRNDRELYDDPAIGEAIMANDRAVMTSGQSQVLEETVQTQDGLRTYLSTKTPYRIAEGEIVGILGIARDITERKRAEEALRESEEKYRTMVETAAEGVVVAGPDGTYTYVNQRMADMLGYTPDELLGKSVHDLTSDDGLLAQVASARDGLREGDAVHGEMEFRRKDGSPLWTAYSISPLRDASGAHIGNLAMHTDITQRKQAEEALRASRAELDEAAAQRQLALDAAKLGWWHYDPLTNVSWYDEGYRTIFDVTGSERPNDEILERLHPDDLPGVWAKVEAALDPADPEPYAAEYRIYRSDGSLRWVEAHGIAAFEGVGDERRATSLVGTVQDITERKQAGEALRRGEEAARRAEARYRTLFNTLIEGFCIIEMVFDADGKPIDYRFLEINRAFEDQTGLHEAQGRLMRDLAPDHEQHWFDIYGKVATTGEPTRFMAPAAALGRYYDVSAFRVGGPESHQVGILFNDIGERHRAEEEREHLLEESQAQAEELQAQSEELRVQGEELQLHYDEQLTQRAALIRENELRAGLNAIGQLLHSTLEPDEVMQRALGEATRALAIDAAAIELREGDAWPVRYAEGLPAEALGSALTGEPVIARQVSYSGEALVLDDVSDHDAVGPLATRHGIRSLMAVPLVAREEILGVLLLVERRAARHFEPAEVDFARRLGSLVGLAIENARLFRADADAASLATVLNEMNGLINSTLDAEEIMQTVVEQAVAAVGADSAMVALRHGDDWVAEYGYPEVPGVIHESVRTDEAPFMVAAVRQRRPIAIDDCETDPRCLPEVQRRFGVRSVLCLPLIVKDEVIGVIFFNHHKAAVAFPPAIVEFAARLARALSIALANARLYEAQRDIATTLQENFIHELPAVAGLEFGVVSKAANEPALVGGDFSDVFVVDDSHVVVLIGDVAGKGVQAAGMTETVRAKIRAFATIDSSPAFILAKTNELLLRFDPDDPHVTAFVAVLDPHTGHLGYASAGHPAPIHLGAFSCRPLALTYGPPLGSFERPYTSNHAMLTLEDYLVLYTDGVTEARRGGELLSERRLLEIVDGLRGRSAQEVAEGVRDAASGFADGRLNDDLQVVVLRLA